MSLGENVRRLRHEKGWTQDQLAERAGMRLQQISRIEKDDGDPRLSTLYKLTQGLECSPNSLLLEPQTDGREREPLLYILMDRLGELTAKQQSDLVPVLDRYCNACDMENAMSKTRRMFTGEE